MSKRVNTGCHVAAGVILHACFVSERIGNTSNQTIGIDLEGNGFVQWVVE